MIPDDASNAENDDFWLDLVTAEDQLPASAKELNLQTAERMAALFGFEPAGRAHSSAEIRLHGPAAVEHSVPVRLGTKALSAVQDLVTAVAMALKGRRSLLGRPSSDILAATELRLFPAASPGSVVFDVQGPPAVALDGRFPDLVDRRNDADLAMDTLGKLFDLSAVANDQVAEMLLTLGPRVASSLRRLTEFPLQRSLYIDLTWRTATGYRIPVSFGPGEAGALQSLIEQRRMAVERTVLSGKLVTVSTEDPLALRLANGNKIVLSTGPDVIRSSLSSYFDTLVDATVEVEVVTTSTGREIRSYTLLQISPGLDIPDETADTVEDDL